MATAATTSAAPAGHAVERRSHHPAATMTAGNAHTQWCIHDTGEASSM